MLSQSKADNRDSNKPCCPIFDSRFLSVLEHGTPHTKISRVQLILFLFLTSTRNALVEVVASFFLLKFMLAYGPAMKAEVLQIISCA